MEQSAHILALASWYQLSKESTDEDDIQDPEVELEPPTTCCSKNPLHIVSIERTSTCPSKYNLEQYGSSGRKFNNRDVMENWIFDAYQYC